MSQLTLKFKNKIFLLSVALLMINGTVWSQESTERADTKLNSVVTKDLIPSEVPDGLLVKVNKTKDSSGKEIETRIAIPVQIIPLENDKTRMTIQTKNGEKVTVPREGEVDSAILENLMKGSEAVTVVTPPLSRELKNEKAERDAYKGESSQETCGSYYGGYYWSPYRYGYGYNSGWNGYYGWGGYGYSYGCGGAYYGYAPYGYYGYTGGYYGIYANPYWGGYYGCW